MFSLDNLTALTSAVTISFRGSTATLLKSTSRHIRNGVEGTALIGVQLSADYASDDVEVLRVSDKLIDEIGYTPAWSDEIGGSEIGVTYCNGISKRVVVRLTATDYLVALEWEGEDPDRDTEQPGAADWAAERGVGGQLPLLAY